MSPTPAASLHTGLLASKGTAQPSRGIARPRGESIASGAESESPLFRALTAAARKAARTNATAARITVRLDERQRLRLRLASAHLGKSRQAILMDALEHYLTEVVPTFLHSPCSCMGGAHSEAGPCGRETP